LPWEVSNLTLPQLVWLTYEKPKQSRKVAIVEGQRTKLAEYEALENPTQEQLDRAEIIRRFLADPRLDDKAAKLDEITADAIKAVRPEWVKPPAPKIVKGQQPKPKRPSALKWPENRVVPINENTGRLT